MPDGRRRATDQSLRLMTRKEESGTAAATLGDKRTDGAAEALLSRRFPDSIIVLIPWSEVTMARAARELRSNCMHDCRLPRLSSDRSSTSTAFALFLWLSSRILVHGTQACRVSERQMQADIRSTLALYSTGRCIRAAAAAATALLYCSVSVSVGRRRLSRGRQLSVINVVTLSLSYPRP